MLDQKEADDDRNVEGVVQHSVNQHDTLDADVEQGARDEADTADAERHFLTADGVVRKRIVFVTDFASRTMTCVNPSQHTLCVDKLG